MTKFFITAPFITVGSRPGVQCDPADHAGDLVDLLLVPATPIESGAALNSRALSSARHPRIAQFGGASGTVSLDRGRSDDDLFRSIPLPPAEQRAMLRARKSNSREAAPGRGCGPSCHLPPAWPGIIARGIMPDPPMPTKK